MGGIQQPRTLPGRIRRAGGEVSCGPAYHYDIALTRNAAPQVPAMDPLRRAPARVEFVFGVPMLYSLGMIGELHTS